MPLTPLTGKVQFPTQCRIWYCVGACVVSGFVPWALCCICRSTGICAEYVLRLVSRTNALALACVWLGVAQTVFALESCVHWGIVCSTQATGAGVCALTIS